MYIFVKKEVYMYTQMYIYFGLKVSKFWVHGPSGFRV